MESEATESEPTESEPTESEDEEEDEMMDVDNVEAQEVEAAQEVAAQTEGEPEQRDGKGGKQKPRTQRSYTEIAKFNSKAEAVHCLQWDGRCYKQYSSTRSSEGCPRGALYRCVLHKDCPRTIRLWFCSGTSRRAENTARHSTSPRTESPRF